ncbi:cytochrome b [Cellvibrio japonicus]|uniref:Putative membrane protein n=1 Tax=Cellvibrio japonicus (strain Ueda107) TaxID=498211 RepID=B3PF62_CELJU|nr:cytochrome b [Cellvibrio japonicus]ACE85184.1 putative membrane protein [Cellvibrio japonicus Ueda107]QEI13617.1 cytochrome b [Cellvibrio japonicus]QEI17191.1 cytochrome b [Cellvibrio japonicus]QEI20768.1 cytochrome b [Cellvibrio japonicus]
MLRDSTQGFGLISIVLHWISALLTLFLFGLGAYLTAYGYYQSNYLQIAHLHYALGILLLMIVPLRLLWRLTSKNPTSLAPTIGMRIGIALSKLGLYVMLLAILVSGYLICTAEGQSIQVFGWFQVPSLVLLENEQLNIASLGHKYLAWALIALVAIHAGAALVHHVWRKDKTLVRMLKPQKPS